RELGTDEVQLVPGAAGTAIDLDVDEIRGLAHPVRARGRRRDHRDVGKASALVRRIGDAELLDTIFSRAVPREVRHARAVSAGRVEPILQALAIADLALPVDRRAREQQTLRVRAELVPALKRYAIEERRRRAAVADLHRR